jgi:hypothetical protein
MGTGFTIDSPLKVARYGISSVISLVDDVLIERMRAHHAKEEGEDYEPIPEHEPDHRARRITEYLNLVSRVVDRQVERLRASSFEAGTEITRYFELLPTGSLRALYERMRHVESSGEREQLEVRLRDLVQPGEIAVNIMTKLDKPHPSKDELASDAMSALRGFAQSRLRSSVVFSAGLNKRLYGYLAKLPDFLPDAAGEVKKRVVIKVSDYRSALIQGRFLAKKGVWVSEFRIESGLNCGGHAFATCGQLLGPILEEFRRSRDELTASLREIYLDALDKRELPRPAVTPSFEVTVQGGVGTAEEHQMLLQEYGVDRVGWGTPFLLVPEVTNVDDDHLQKLQKAVGDEVYLSDSSPLGVPFWNLRTSASEAARLARIARGRPGSPCPKGYLASNTDFTELPICTASRGYQRRVLTPGMSSADEARVTVKSCICHDLAGGATQKLGLDTKATPAVCCGPNIVNFSRLATLAEMVGHIYGRLSLLVGNSRSHMFVRELELYRDHLRREASRFLDGARSVSPAYLAEFRQSLLEGIEHYRDVGAARVQSGRDRFVAQIESLAAEIREITIPELEAATSRSSATS